MILAKKSGLFDGYIAPEATLSECLTFFNRQGVYFGLMEVVNGAEFTKSDCARVFGQIELLLSGEAEFVMGNITLPEGIETWSDFCLLNGVEYADAYDSITLAADIENDAR